MKALLLVGSPHRNGNSSSLGTYLVDQLRTKNWSSERADCFQAIRDPRAMDTLLAHAADADLIILTAPLYADGPPAIVLSVFQALADLRKTTPAKPGQRFLAIFNCGFPESSQNHVALECCRAFAEDLGYEWAGGLGMGMGGAIAEKRLERAGGVARYARRALELAAEALNRNEPVPTSVAALFSRPPMPKWLYLAFGNLGWRVQAWQNKLGRRGLYAQPYGP